MPVNSSNNLYGFPQPLSRVFPAPIIAQRAPTTADINYPIGQSWIDEAGDDAYILVDVTAATATWNVIAPSPGEIATLTGDSGGAIAPSAGNVSLLGTANQITTTGSGSQIAWTLSSTLVAPGTVGVTGLLTANAGITSSGGALTLNSGTNAIALSSDASATTVNLGTGAAAKTVTLGSTNTTSTTTIRAGSGGIALTGAVTSANAITVTAGAITATNGNLVFGTAGNKILSTSVGTTTSAGANSFGSVTLSSGTATVATTSVTSSSLIFLWRQSIGSTGAAALGQLTVGTITNGTSFVINAALTATATSLATTDVSVVGWMIVN